MRKLHLLLLSALCVFMISCQQEIDDVLTNPPGNGNNNNNNNNNNTSGGLYQPLTAGTWWKYKDSASGNLTTNTATSVTKTLNNINYRAITAGNGDTAYYGVKGPGYYFRAAGLSPSGLPFDLTFNYLNDTASVGYSWQYNAGQGNGFTAITNTKIIEKGITMTVEGKTYTDVIHTFLVLSYDMGGTPSPYGEYDFFIAKIVGIIKSRADLASGLFISCTNLVDHHVQ
jgi:hypothetical protein